MTLTERFWLWVARRSLHFMSNRAAWWLHQSMIEAYRARPDLAGEGD